MVRITKTILIPHADSRLYLYKCYGAMEIKKEYTRICCSALQIIDGAEITLIFIFEISNKGSKNTAQHFYYENNVVQFYLSLFFLSDSFTNERRAQQEPPHKANYLLLTYFLQLFNTLSAAITFVKYIPLYTSSNFKFHIYVIFSSCIVVSTDGRLCVYNL